MRFLYLLLCLCATAPANAQPTLDLIDLSVSLNAPVDITGAGDGSERLFIVEQNGFVRVYDQATATLAPGAFLDISSRTTAAGERGLLGLAFHPDFATNGYFFVNYTADGVPGVANGTTIVARYTVQPGAAVADPNSELVILTVAQPRGNHNAGDLAFGPDGYLYVPLGDSGGSNDPGNVAQDFQTLLGSLLRIDVDNPAGARNYGIPADNPFVGNPSVADEIWAVGLRNPWRISFDRQTGDLWIADVGQNAREEVNFQPASSSGGENYGWDCREGDIANPSTSTISPDCVPGGAYDDPIFTYAHSGNQGGRSITGGFVYRGQQAADLVGYYLCADFVSNRFFLLPPAGTSPRTLLRQTGLPVFSVSTFGEDDDGNLFVASLGGSVYEVSTLLSLPVSLTAWEATAISKTTELTWTVASEENVNNYVVERSPDRIAFEAIGEVSAGGDGNYVFTDPAPLPGENVYRLRINDNNETFDYSPVRRVVFTETTPGLQILPNPNGGRFTLRTPIQGRDGLPVLVEIHTLDGRLLVEQKNDLVGSDITVDTGNLLSGVYRISVYVDGETYGERLVIRR